MMLQNVGAQIVLRNWWMLAVRGVLAIIFGLVVLLFPGIAILAFIYVFAAYAIIDGIVAIVVSLSERGTFARWIWVLVEGILGILAGIVAIAYPGLTALVLLYIVAAWAVLTGILEIVAAVTFRGQIALEWALNLAGLFSILFGFLLFIQPGTGILTILWLVGVYAIVFGVLFIVRALQLRAWASVVAAPANLD
jgi:uncharacterized membrane protein HdeD (DUF308 family)